MSTPIYTRDLSDIYILTDKNLISSWEDSSVSVNPIPTNKFFKDTYDTVNNTISCISVELSAGVDNKISTLNYSDTSSSGQFVTKVSQTSGIISVSRSSLVESDIPTIGTSKISGLSNELKTFSYDSASNTLSIDFAGNIKTTTIIGGSGGSDNAFVLSNENTILCSNTYNNIQKFNCICVDFDNLYDLSAPELISILKPLDGDPYVIQLASRENELIFCCSLAIEKIESVSEVKKLYDTAEEINKLLPEEKKITDIKNLKDVYDVTEAARTTLRGGENLKKLEGRLTLLMEKISFTTHNLDLVANRVDNLSNELSGVIGGSISSISAELSTLKTNISSIVKIGSGEDESCLSNSQLSVWKLSKSKYEQLLVDDKLNDCCLYIISSDYIDAYSRMISNVSMAPNPYEDDSYLGIAATKNYVDNMSSKIISSQKDVLSGLKDKPEYHCFEDMRLSGMNSYLSTAISSIYKALEYLGAFK